MPITMQSYGFPEAIDKITRAADRKLIYRGVTRGASVIQKQARLNAASAIKNGQFVLGRRIAVIGRPERLEAEIGPDWIGGRLTELGGIVRPVHKKWLSWWVSDTIKPGGLRANIGAASRRVFAKLTVHRPHPYLFPAVPQTWDRVQAVILEPLSKIFGQSPGGTE